MPNWVSWSQYAQNEVTFFWSPSCAKDSSWHEVLFCRQENEGEGDSADPWTGSDRDYLYDELLQVSTFFLKLTSEFRIETQSNLKLFHLLSESVRDYERQEPRHGGRREKEVCDETAAGEWEITWNLELWIGAYCVNLTATHEKRNIVSCFWT